MSNDKNEKQQELLQAWRKKDINKFKKILADPLTDPNYLYTDEGYVTLLEITSKDSYDAGVGFAQALLESGAKTNQINVVSGRTPLHEAAAHINYSILNAILSHGGDSNAKDSTGSTALHLLAQLNCSGKQLEKQLACIDVLLSQNSIDINHKNNKGQTSLSIACQRGAKNFIVKLLGQGSRLDVDSGPKPLREEILKKFPDLTNELPPLHDPQSIHVKMEGNNFFILLHSGEEERFCEIFCREMKDKSKHGLLSYTDGQQTFLQYATNHKYHVVMSEILKQGANPDATPSGGKRPLHLACANGDTTAVSLLLQHDAKLDPDETGDIPLHIAARDGHVDCVEMLIKAGAKVDVEDKNGRTALHIAARCGHQKCCRKLLELGAYLGSQDKFHNPLVKILNYRMLEEFLDSRIAYSNRCCDDYRLDLDLRFLNPNRGKKSDDSALATFSQGISKYPKTFSPEIKPLLDLARSNSRRILAHPVLASFAQCKVQNIAAFFYTQLILNAIFTILVTAYCLLGYQRPTNEFPFYVLLFQLLLGIFIGFRFICSLVPAIVRPLDHFSRFDTWINFMVNAFVIIIVAKDCPRENLPQNLDGKCQVFSSLSVLLSWVQFTFLVLCHPGLATLKLILKRFFYSSVKILIYAGFIFLAFSISLHLLQQNCSNCSALFQNLGLSVYHVLVIAAGDVKSESTPNVAPGIAHLIFLVFLFFITVLLSNLLIGIVVYETLNVHEEGLVTLVESQLKIAAKVENIIEDFRYLRRHTKMLIPCPKNVWLKSIVNRVFFFSQCDTIAVLPHENGKVEIEVTKMKTKPVVIYIKMKVVDKAEEILRKREEKKPQSQSSQKITPVLKETIPLECKPEGEKSSIPPVVEEDENDSSEQLLRYMTTFMTRLDTLEQYGKQTEDLLIKILEIYSVHQASNS